MARTPLTGVDDPFQVYAGHVPGVHYQVYEVDVTEIQIGDMLTGTGYEVASIARADHNGQPALRFGLALAGPDGVDDGRLILVRNPSTSTLFVTGDAEPWTCVECKLPKRQEDHGMTIQGAGRILINTCIGCLMAIRTDQPKKPKVDQQVSCPSCELTGPLDQVYMVINGKLWCTGCPNPRVPELQPDEGDFVHGVGR